MRLTTVTWWLALNIGVFTLADILNSDLGFAIHPLPITHGHELQTLVLAQFMHSNALHLTGNLLPLLAFGPEVEKKLRGENFLALYLTAGSLAMISQVLAAALHPELWNLRIMGASGAIAGVLGAYVALYPNDRLRIRLFTRYRSMPVAIAFVSWFLFSVLCSLGAPIARGGIFVGHAAHVVGFLIGGALAFSIKWINS